jgi:nicotinamidase-related amidase
MNETTTIDKNTALLVVDVQQALDYSEDGPMNKGEKAEENIGLLVKKWRKENRPLFFVQYLSPRPGSPFHKDAPHSGLKPVATPLSGEPHVIKHFESVFMRTDLEEQLKQQGIHTLIFTGFYTDQCIAASAKVANNLGFNVIVAADASATTRCKGYNGKVYQAEDIHQLTLGALQRDGITVMETEKL